MLTTTYFCFCLQPKFSEMSATVFLENTFNVWMCAVVWFGGEKRAIVVVWSGLATEMMKLRVLELEFGEIYHYKKSNK